VIFPQWPAPGRVRAASTTRLGGVSAGAYDSFNLATHVGDAEAAVRENRARLRQQLKLPAEPLWLNQVHGSDVAEVEDTAAGLCPAADASIGRASGRVCAVMTADCLPVLLCDRGGTVVAAAHAGWRGLAGGVLETTVDSLGVEPQYLLAWLGPAIGPAAFEVGPEVRAAFVDVHAPAAAAFEPQRNGRWLADIYRLARIRLAAAGVDAVYGGGFCTFADRERFYSFRRDKVTGRMVSLIWLE
jgi:YfiH family protein